MSKANMTQVYSLYVNIMAKGDNLIQVKGVIEDLLDETIGASNYKTIEVYNMTDDEVVEFATGIHDNDADEVVGKQVIHDVEVVEPTTEINVELELDELDIKRDEMVSDELG